MVTNNSVKRDEHRAEAQEAQAAAQAGRHELYVPRTSFHKALCTKIYVS